MPIESRKQFINELAELNHKVVRMGDEVYKSYVKLISVCETGDTDLANEIKEQDKLINEMEISINVDAYLLIAKQCPVASDLRRIITALKISNELERIGDYAVNISRYIRNSKHGDNVEFLNTIKSLSSIFIEMLENIIEAFRHEDIQLALQVSDSDEVLDKEYKKSVKKLIKIAKVATDEEVEEAMKALLAIKQLERAGDHVTNIAENIIYLVNGKRVELN